MLWRKTLFFLRLWYCVCVCVYVMMEVEQLMLREQGWSKRLIIAAGLCFCFPELELVILQCHIVFLFSLSENCIKIIYIKHFIFYMRTPSMRTELCS